MNKDLKTNHAWKTDKISKRKIVHLTFAIFCKIGFTFADTKIFQFGNDSLACKRGCSEAG